MRLLFERFPRHVDFALEHPDLAPSKIHELDETLINSSGEPDITCVPGTTVPASPDTLEPAVYFDLILCTTGREENVCLVTSETLDDTNEGFDIMLPEEFRADDLSIYVLKPKAELITPCNENVYEP